MVTYDSPLCGCGPVGLCGLINACTCRNTGKPYYNVIVWNDTRTTGICEELKKDGGIDRFRDKTGLPLTPYFSATKIVWLLNNVPGLREAAEKGEALFGTIDTWLVYNLTGGSLRCYQLLLADYVTSSIPYHNRLSAQ